MGNSVGLRAKNVEFPFKSGRRDDLVSFSTVTIGECLPPILRPTRSRAAPRFEKHFKAFELVSPMRSPFPPMRGEWIPDGDAGVAATISKMTSLVGGPQGVRSFLVRKAAIDAARGTERGVPEIDSVDCYIRDNIEFRGEYGETLQSPEATLTLGAGDCDDQSVLGAAMLQSLGFQTRFKTVAISSSPDELSHVYLEVMDKQTGRWISMDPTVANSYPGWEPDDIARSESYGTMSPAGGITGDLILAAAIGLGFALLS